jgi:hypothetical protein
VVHDQLTVLAEQLAHGHPAVRAVELVPLVDPHPGQAPAPGREFVAEPGQVLLALEQV